MADILGQVDAPLYCGNLPPIPKDIPGKNKAADAPINSDLGIALFADVDPRLANEVYNGGHLLGFAAGRPIVTVCEKIMA